MVTQEDTIFVSGMDPSISEEEICQHFGAIGVIKVRIFIHGYLFIAICNINNKCLIRDNTMLSYTKKIKQYLELNVKIKRCRNIYRYPF